MTTRRRRATCATMVALLFAGMIVALVVPWDNLFARLYSHRAQLLRMRVLRDTDFRALLEAGRDVLGQVPKEYWNAEGRRLVGDLPLPKGTEIPRAIWGVRPRGIFISRDGFLTIEMHGGMDHFGVRIYPEDFSTPRIGFKYGDRELVEGLWYYDENYRLGSTYDREIERMLGTNNGVNPG